MSKAIIAENIKEIPADAESRAAIRQKAVLFAARFFHAVSPTRAELEAAGSALLLESNLPRGYLGFAMVAISNAYWFAQFTAVPFSRRLLLLPRCLRHAKACQALVDARGVHCVTCGACCINEMLKAARALGYRVQVAEGTAAVLMDALGGEADAILGVACLDSLEASFARVADMGIPHLAVPLLSDGCVDTRVEQEEVFSLLGASGGVVARSRSYLPIYRAALRVFDDSALDDLLRTALAEEAFPAGHPLLATKEMALAWLRRGGKRLRPFITLAAYAVARYGEDATTGGIVADDLLPAPVKRLGVAIEAMHKASLAHDDIEDDDESRYGKPTLHKLHGMPQAINIGDYLVGLGYRLALADAEFFGADAVLDIQRSLASAHLALCGGQGSELLQTETPAAISALDVLAIYARKTSPAFEAALFAGMRAAGPVTDISALKRYCAYLGQAYQVANDLEDLQQDEQSRRAGSDLPPARPTILYVFAREAGMTAMPEDVEEAREIYSRLGVFDKARVLLSALLGRALNTAGEVHGEAMGEFLRSLARMIIREEQP